MAWLRHLGSDLVFVPGARAVVGRAPGSALVEADPKVSAEHAALTWGGAGWTVRDLGSRNGTFVGERRVPAGESAALGRDDVVRFGDSSWRLVDDGPPGAVAVTHGAVRVARGGLLALPDDDGEVSALEGSGGWTIEQEGTPRPARDGETVHAGGRAWTLHLPRGGALPPTVEADVTRALARVALVVRVSADEEYVEVEVRRGGQTDRLPPRTWHDLFLVLGRERAADQARGASAAEAGWVYFDDLCKGLGRDRRTVNVEVFRARQQIADVGVDGAADVFERRAPTRQIRLGIADVTVAPL